MMAVMMLLNSCATPPASLPTVSIFWDWNNLRFKPFALGDVLIRPLHLNGSPRGIFGNGDVDEHMPNLAIPAKNATFELRTVVPISRSHRLADLIRHQVGIVRMQEFPGEILGRHLVAVFQFGGSAVEGVIAVAEGKESAGHVIFPSDQLRQAHGVSEPDFDFSQRLLISRALGDVTVSPDSAIVFSILANCGRCVSGQNRPVLEINLVVADFIRVSIKMVDSFEELLWIFDRVRNPPKPVLLGSLLARGAGAF